MTSFAASMQTAKSTICAWSESANICEATLVRDAKGKVSIYLKPVAGQVFSESALTTLKGNLTVALGHFFCQTIYVENKEPWTADLFQRLKELRVEEFPSVSGIQWFTIERGIAKKAWIQCNQRENAAWSYADTQLSSPQCSPKIVTFFSYKGGMGRTTALVASALELIRQHKNVLMIDTDLEAPGLSTFFFQEGDAGQIIKGTVDYLLEKSLDPNATMNMTDYVLELTSPNFWEDSYGKLFLVSGGKLDGDFLPKLARIDSQELVEGKLKSSLINLLMDCRIALQPSGGIDYILIDSRAGFHDMAGIVTAQLPHGVVLFGKDSYQSWFGIQRAVNTIATSQSDKPFAIIVDSGCGTNGLVSDQEKEKFRRKAYDVFCSEYYGDSSAQPGLMAHGEAHDPVFIRYSPALSQDIPLYDSSKSSDLVAQLADTPYKELVGRIMKEFGDEPEGGFAE